MTISRNIGRGFWAHSGHVPACMVGTQYGALTVIARAKSPPTSRNEPAWLCVCDCGAKHITRGSRLRSGRVSSCGRWCASKAKARPKQRATVHLTVEAKQP